MPKLIKKKVCVALSLVLGTTVIWTAGAYAEDAAAKKPAAEAAAKAPDTQSYDPESVATFIKAARYGQADVVKAHLDKKMVAETDYLGNTALITAAGGGHADIVKMLLDAGANPNAANKKKRTALMEASVIGDDASVKYLLDAKADVNSKDHFGETALFDAVRYGHLVTTHTLLDAGADPNINNTRPIKAADSGYTPLMYAAKRRPVPDVIPVTAWLRITKALLAKGANPDTRNNMGSTALNIATDYGNQDVASILLKGGAKEVLTYKGLNLDESLLMAATKGDEKEVHQALKLGADPQSVSPEGVTPLMAATYSGNLGSVKAIVENGAYVNNVASGYRAWTWTAEHIATGKQPLAKTASMHYTALILAAEKGYDDIVAYLLEKGAKPEIANVAGDTALSMAAKHGDAKIVSMLLDKGVDPSEKPKVALRWTADAVDGIRAQTRNSPLAMAAQGGYADVVKVLLEKGADPDMRGFAGKTALFWAVERGYPDVVNLLLAHDANPNIANDAGQTPLMEAAKDGRADMAQALVANNADLNAKEGNEGLPGTLDVSDGTGMTPLMLAVVGKQVSVAKILLQAGADINLRNRSGKDALDLAERSGDADLIGLLSNGAK